MSTETTTPETSQTTEADPKPPATGVAAAARYLTEHLSKQDESNEGDDNDGDEDDDDEESSKDKPKEPGKDKPKRSVAHKLKRKREQVRQLKEQSDALMQRLAEFEAKAKEPKEDLAALAKSDLVAALDRLGLAPEDALDLLQKHALNGAGLSPAARKALDDQAKKLKEVQDKLSKTEEERQAQAEAEAHERGLRELRAEYGKIDRYPELEGYEPKELDDACFQAVQFLQAQGRKSADPEEILGIVNEAFGLKHKAEEERVRKRAEKRTGKAPPAKTATPPPKAKAAPRKEETDEDEDPDLDPVTPTKKGKVKLPSLKEIERRALQANRGLLICLVQARPALTASLRWSSSRPERCPAHADSPSDLDSDPPKVLPCLLALKTSPQQRTF